MTCALTMHACTQTQTSKLDEVCTAQEEEANQEADNKPECNPDVLTRSQSASGGLTRVCQMVGWWWPPGGLEGRTSPSFCVLHAVFTRALRSSANLGRWGLSFVLVPPLLTPNLCLHCAETVAVTARVVFSFLYFTVPPIALPLVAWRPPPACLPRCG